MDNVFDFESYITELKATVDLVEIINQDEPLVQRGKAWRGQRHDSLQVSPDKGLWNWHSRGIGGDVLSWCQHIRNWEFKQAVEELARQYDLPRPEWHHEDAQARLAAQQQYDIFSIAVALFARNLRNSQVALNYCYSRGWSNETLTTMNLGYWDGDKSALIAQLQMHGINRNNEGALALLEAPSNMLVYPHLDFGRVRYVSYRSIEGKKHWNPPRDYVGDRKPMFNPSAALTGPIVIVEGQADVVTLQQWGIPAVALAGVSIGQTGEGSRLAHYISKHDPVFWATDADRAGQQAIHKAAEIFGPMIRVVVWPDHDANDWLMNDPKHATADAAATILTNAPIYALILAKDIGEMSDYRKPEGLKCLMRLIARMDPAEQSVYRKPISEAANVSVSVFDRLLSVHQGETDNDDEDAQPLPYTTVGGLVDGHLLEMLYVPPDHRPANAILLQGGQTMFAVRDAEGNIEIKPFFDSDGMRFFPLQPNVPILQESVVIFPQGVGKLLTANELVRRIRALIHKYVDVDEFYETLSAYYVLFSWFYDAFPTLSYLRVKGDAGTGKTRFLEVVGSLCYRPLLMNAGASVAAMFRVMDMVRGTLVLDEGDFAKSDESADIAKLLNVGNQRRQGRISRAGTRETDFTPEFFYVYGPKVISTRKAYDDQAIESRCLTKETGAPTSRMDIPRNLPDSFWTDEVPEMQGLLLRYRLEYWSPELNKKVVPIDNTVEPRLQQVTDSLKKMINDPEMLNELELFIQHYNYQMIMRRGLKTEAKILEAMYVLFETQLDVQEADLDFSMGSIAEIANDLMDYENATPIEHWSRYTRRERSRRISSKGAGHLISNTLQLQTERKASDPRRRYHVVWDGERIRALWQRFGLGTDQSRQQLMNTYETIQQMIKDREFELHQQQG